MTESVQAVLALFMIIATIGSALSFGSDRPHWGLFAGMVSLGLGSGGFLLWSLLRRDKVPDFLKQVPGPLLERDHFCFKLAVGAAKGRCHLDIHFQGRSDRPSRAMILVQPSQGFFLRRPDLASLTVDVDCPPGGSGVISVPWGVGKKFQGKAQALDVGADVFYPAGRGTLIRYRGGKQVPTAGFDTWRAVLTATAALGGIIVLHKPVRVQVRFPTGVEESVADDLPIATRIVWNLPDAPAPVEGAGKPAADPYF